ncbi:MAG: zinc ribbon domain-containing protein [Chloroflexi bacterium]|nr:zinc ribbon domain-containing protein [Chloroflexota bacterium]
MPIYEYRCAACSGLTSVFLRSMSQEPPDDQRCEDCGSAELGRVMSKVARLKTGQDVIDEHGTPGAGGAYRDPRQIGRWVEDRFADYGMDLPDETRQMIDAARDGELPDSVADA